MESPDLDRGALENQSMVMQNHNTTQALCHVLLLCPCRWTWTTVGRSPSLPWIFSLLIAESFQFRRAIYPESAEDTADKKRQQESIKNEMDLSVKRIDARGNVSYSNPSHGEPPYSNVSYSAPGHGEPLYVAGDGGVEQKLV